MLDRHNYAAPEAAQNLTFKWLYSSASSGVVDESNEMFQKAVLVMFIFGPQVM